MRLRGAEVLGFENAWQTSWKFVVSCQLQSPKPHARAKSFRNRQQPTLPGTVILPPPPDVSGNQPTTSLPTAHGPTGHLSRTCDAVPPVRWLACRAEARKLGSPPMLVNATANGWHEDLTYAHSELMITASVYHLSLYPTSNALTSSQDSCTSSSNSTCQHQTSAPQLQT